MAFTQTVYTPYDDSPTPAVGPDSLIVESTATPAVNVDLLERVSITALAVPITGFTFTGHPGDGKRIRIRIKDNGTARAIAWGAQVIAGSAALPTTTTAGKPLTVDLEYDAADAKYACMAASSRI